MKAVHWALPLAAWVLSPLMLGIINRVKALFAGRQGQPVWQLYYDLFKLLRKASVYSRTTSTIFRAAPAVVLALAVWITVRLQLTQGEAPPILPTSSFFAMLVGLFLMVTRRKAITQSLAYLVMENGVYGVGVSMSLDFPFIVELGILLDVFVGVFLMGNLLFHLDREFEHLDTDKLTELSDVSESAAFHAEEQA